MPNPSTASRSTADLDRFYGTTIEEWDDGVEEVVFEENSLLYVMNSVGKHWKTGGRDVGMSFTSVKNDTAEAFAGTQHLKVSASQGPSTALWSLKNYKVSVQTIWEEEVENSGMSALLDKFQEAVENAELSLAELLDEVLKSGQGNGSKHFQGLEEAVFAGDPSAGTAPSLTRTQFFSGADNTYAGIDRSGTDDGAVGWRNGAMDIASLTDGFTSRTSATSAYPALRRAYNLCSRGTRTPDLILMTLDPYEHFEGLGEDVVRYNKGLDGQMGRFNFPFECFAYHNATVVKWEGGTNSGLNGNDAATGAQMVYLLSTMYWKLTAETQAWFAWTDFIRPSTQMARVAHMVVRLTPRCINPRYQGVLHDYTVS